MLADSGSRGVSWYRRAPRISNWPGVIAQNGRNAYGFSQIAAGAQVRQLDKSVQQPLSALKNAA